MNGSNKNKRYYKHRQTKWLIHEIFSPATFSRFSGRLKSADLPFQKASICFPALQRPNGLTPGTPDRVVNFVPLPETCILANMVSKVEKWWYQLSKNSVEDCEILIPQSVPIKMMARFAQAARTASMLCFTVIYDVEHRRFKRLFVQVGTTSHRAFAIASNGSAPAQIVEFRKCQYR